MLSSYDKPVRCSAGHLFTTIWVPFASFKALRLGFRRYQYCPVGKHWAMVSVVKDIPENLGDLDAARKVHDLRIP